MAESLGLTSESFAPDRLIAGHTPLATRKITLLSGENRTRGALLGEVGKSTPTTGTADGGNTGNGTMTGVLAGLLAIIGTYVLECILAPSGTPTMPTTGTADGGNTGNGTMTGVTVGTNPLAGTYTVECIEDAVTGTAASGSERFKVIDPLGNRLDDSTVGVGYTGDQINFTLNDGGTDFQKGDFFTVASSAVDGNDGVFKVLTPEEVRLEDASVAVAYVSDHLNFTINDGGTDFVVGDKFTVAVAAGSGKYILSLAAAVDGTQTPSIILAKDTDASAADVETIGYEKGEFSEGNMTFGAGHTFANTRDGLRDKGIILKETTEYFT